MERKSGEETGLFGPLNAGGKPAFVPLNFYVRSATVLSALAAGLSTDWRQWFGQGSA